MRVLIVTRNFKLASGLNNMVLDHLRSSPEGRIAVEQASLAVTCPRFSSTG